MCRKYVLLGIALGALALLAQQKPASTPAPANRIELGRLSNGAAVAFVRTGGEWGIQISGGDPQSFAQPKPAQIEVYRGGDNATDLASGYQSVTKEADSVVAKAKVSGGEAVFAVEDRWKVAGAVLSVSRKVTVTGGEANAGFYSAVRFSTARTVAWPDADYLVPGLLYGEPHNGANGPAGVNALRAKRLNIREDYFSAPVIGIWFRDGRSVAVMDPAPRGDTTEEETEAPATKPIIDERIQFGALGARENSEGGIEFGFWLPGTTAEFSGGGFGGRGAIGPPPPQIVRRRYHPVKAGFSQNYQVALRFGQGESFAGMERDAWRWAWQTLKPKTYPIDVEAARKALIDHMADQTIVYEGRAGIPFVIDAVSGKPGSFRPAYVLASRGGRGIGGGPPATPGVGAPAGGGRGNAPGTAPGGRGPTPSINATAPVGPSGSRPAVDTQELAQWAKTALNIDMDPNAAELNLWANIILGFCGKHIEVGEQFIEEADREPGPRSDRVRKLGMTVIDSQVKLVPMSPFPSGEGFNLRTGKVIGGAGIRSLSEDMRTMVDLLRYERAHGRQHPDWFAWAKDYADDLLKVQHEDGSYPSGWNADGGTRTGPTVTSYAPPQFLVRMAEETGDRKYLDSAIRAAEYIWANYASRDLFLGATGGDVSDKESGMLTMESFLSLYDNTKDPKWLSRAKVAADYTESWIRLWNVPMPIGADPAGLGWKPGIPTTGANGIAANVSGEVDQYLDWAAPSYAKLYKLTNDEHYLDVARILLHDTKAMTALPGRTYDLKGPGWQQEHWRMGPGVRGIGAHRTWLPWISVNHVHSIIGLEELDKALYQRLSKGN